MRRGLIAVVLMLASASGWAQMEAIHNVYSDKEVAAAKEFVVKVDGKMPLWDADKTGPYERDAILKVKFDISVCAADVDVPEFMDHVDTLTDDWDELNAIDEALKIESVI